MKNNIVDGNLNVEKMMIPPSPTRSHEIGFQSNKSEA
jgi:hypothetical protein